MTGGGEPGGAEPEGVEPGGAEPEGVEPGGAASEGAESEGAEPQGAASSGGSTGASPRLSPQQLLAGDAGAGGTGVAARAGVPGGTAATGPGGARTRGTGAAGTSGVEGAGAGDPTESGATVAGGSGAGCTGAGVGGTGAEALELEALVLEVLGTQSSTSLTPPLLCPSPDQSQSHLQPASPLPAPSRYTEQSGGLTERHEPASRPISPSRTACRVPQSRPPPVPGTHAMTLRPSFVPLRAAMDAEMASWKSTVTHVDEVPPPGANIFDGMWIFKVKRPPGSPPAFKARYVARGFSQQQGVEFFQTFSPTPKMTTLRVLLHVAAQRDYELHSLDFSTTFLLRRQVYGLHQAPHESHDTLSTTIAALGFSPSTADPSLFLRTDTSLPPFYVLVYINNLVFATADTEALTLVMSELQKRHTCTDLGELRSYLGL
ncbi:unnamed protein product [Closterium sp. NIES-54]